MWLHFYIYYSYMLQSDVFLYKAWWIHMNICNMPFQGFIHNKAWRANIKLKYSYSIYTFMQLSLKTIARSIMYEKFICVLKNIKFLSFFNSQSWHLYWPLHVRTEIVIRQEKIEVIVQSLTKIEAVMSVQLLWDTICSLP